MPDYRQVAAQAAARYGLGPWFVNQIQAESGFNPNARSPAGALGIAQFMPGTAKGMGVDPMNPVQALDGAARLMANYMRQYKNPRLALAAYNAGPGNVAKYGGVPPFKETQNYISHILGAGAGSGGGGSFVPGSSFAASGTPQVVAQAGGQAPQPSPFAQRQQFGQQVIASLGRPDTHQRMMSLIGAVLGMRRSPQAASTFAPLGSQSQGAGEGYNFPDAGRGAGRGHGANVKSGSPVAGLTKIGGAHPTLGLKGYPAHDYFAPAGSTAVAPIGGTVVRLSGHDPSLGPTQGKHGPLGWSVYIQGANGHTYFLTHMGSRNVKVGQQIQAGQPIGTVADYDRYGTASHIHMGVR